MKEKNLMLSGKLYKAADDELNKHFFYDNKKPRHINLTPHHDS